MMKRTAPILLLLVVFLAACNQRTTPTVNDADMATKVAQILTNMPTSTGQAPKTVTATMRLPSVTPVLVQNTTEAPKTATPTKEATATPLAPTETLAATQPIASATAAATLTATKAATQTLPAPTATLNASDPKSTLGNPTWTDSLNSGGNWPTGTDPAGYTRVDFQDGFMLFTALKPVDGWRLTFKRLSDAYLEMTVNTGNCLPKDRYGVIVRVPSASDANQGYLFGFTCDGKFAIRKWDGEANNMTTFINWKANPAINSGANKTNRLGVKMAGNKLSLYANGILLDSIQDSTWLEGNFGIFAGAHESAEYSLKVDEISYWD